MTTPYGTEEPPQTCPMINEAQKGIAKAMDYAKDAGKSIDTEDYEDAHGLCEDTESELSWIDLEEIRGNCELLRQWGTEWKEEAEEARAEAEEGEAQIRRLEARVAWLEGILERQR